jgi:dynein heavy chain
MNQIHPMYHMSFSSFEQLLERASAQAARTALSKTQVLMDTITSYVFRMVTRGYFDVHRQLFALQLAFHTLKQQDILTDAMLLFVIRGSISAITVPPKPMQLSWLTLAQWQDLHLLQAVGPSVFQNLVASVTSDGTWRNWVMSDDPERSSPVGISINLQAFPVPKLLQLLLLRCFRPDRFLLFVRDFISDILGAKYSTPGSVSFERLAEEADELHPILLISNMSSDPFSIVLDLARRSKVKLISESVGQPVGFVRNAISKAMALGVWILIRNMHLDLACCRDEITKAFQVEASTQVLIFRNV